MPRLSKQIEKLEDLLARKADRKLQKLQRPLLLGGLYFSNMAGAKIDYVITHIDREGECAIASRRLALSKCQNQFAALRSARNGHNSDITACNVLSVGPTKMTVECGGYDIVLSPRDICWSAVPDLTGPKQGTLSGAGGRPYSAENTRAAYFVPFRTTLFASACTPIC